MKTIRLTFYSLIILSFAISGFKGFDKNSKSELVQLGSKREIFVDSYLIDKLVGTQIVMHKPIDEGIVLYFDKPWEGLFCGYATIIKDGDLYRVYYRGWNGISASQFTCYAESKDGINWIKPVLGLCEVNGSKENNVLLTTEPETHNFSPFIDKNPGAKADSKYKALGGGSKTGLIPYVSSDGIHWKKLQNEGVIKKGAFDSQNVSFWSESEGLYVCYFRIFTEKKFRSVSRATSKDFINWTEPVEMSYRNTPSEHLYTQQTSPYFRAPHIYIAIGSRLIPNRQVLKEEQLIKLKVDPTQYKGLSEPFLMTTRGGSVYDRTFMESFIRPGLGLNNWSARTNYPALNIVQTGPEEMSLYVNQDYAQPTSHLRRYSMRIDGLTSISAPYSGGEVITKLFTFTGKELEVNYSTAAVGDIRIEILDETGKAIPGFTLIESQTLIGNEIERVISWKGNESVEKISSKPIRLHFLLKDADLYSFRFK